MPCARLSKSSTKRPVRSEVVVALRQRNESGAKVALSPVPPPRPHVSPLQGGSLSVLPEGFPKALRSPALFAAGDAFTPDTAFHILRGVYGMSAD
jgi:hypothetical protein